MLLLCLFEKRNSKSSPDWLLLQLWIRKVTPILTRLVLGYVQNSNPAPAFCSWRLWSIASSSYKGTTPHSINHQHIQFFRPSQQKKAKIKAFSTDVTLPHYICGIPRNARNAGRHLIWRCSSLLTLTCIIQDDDRRLRCIVSLTLY